MSFPECFDKSDESASVLHHAVELHHYILHSGPYRHPRGDASFFEETLYEAGGILYLWGQGGHISPYRKRMSDGYWGPGERIIHMTDEEARQWAADRLGSHPDSPIDSIDASP